MYTPAQRKWPITHNLSVWAYVLILQDPRKFYVNQVPHSALADAGFPPQAKLLVLLLGNVYLLLAPLAIICIWTPHRSVATYYLMAVGLGDLGHIYATYQVCGDVLGLDSVERYDVGQCGCKRVLPSQPMGYFAWPVRKIRQVDGVKKGSI